MVLDRVKLKAALKTAMLDDAASHSQDCRHKLCVIGNGMVGQRLLDMLVEWQVSQYFAITVFSEEPRPAYDRVHLSDYFSGRTEAEFSLAASSFYQQQGIELVLNERVCAIDRDKKMISTGQQRQVSYDTLVLATGSYPFVPPIAGRDRNHCFVYRTVEDLAAIESSGQASQVGVVVGGGLLGLEAANALKQMGLKTHVVECAPRLMATQIDEGGAQLLKNKIESLGVDVHTNKNTESIVAGQQCRHKMIFADGTDLETDMIVFSAGIRPNDDLAKSCGLALGKRGGMAINHICQTTDPSIFAIGECASWQDKLYGLVAPGYQMAKVVAQHLTLMNPSIEDESLFKSENRVNGGGSHFDGSDLSTKLKLLGVGVGSIGDAHASTEGSLSFQFYHEPNQTYQKIVVSQDQKYLLGAVLIGDVGNYDMLLQFYSNKIQLPQAPETMILPNHFSHGKSAAPMVGFGVSSLPETAQICSCHCVTKGDLVTAIDGGATTVSELKACTKNGTYSVVPRVAAGEITPDKLIVLGQVAKEFQLYTKITGGQRVDLFGATVDQLPLIWQRLIDAGFETGHAYGKSVRTVKSCVGDGWCRFGVDDSMGLAIQLENRYKGLRAPHKLKFAVSGCTRECAEAQSKDIGIIATEHGWNLYVGGNGGMKPRHGELFATHVDRETLIQYIDRILMFYVRTGDRLQSTSVWMESLEGGLEYLQGVIIDDRLQIAAELESEMAHIIGTYECEWQATLNDPNKLKRFKTFVNSDAKDKTIQMVKERDQLRPARRDEQLIPVLAT